MPWCKLGINGLTKLISKLCQPIDWEHTLWNDLRVTKGEKKIQKVDIKKVTFFVILQFFFLMLPKLQLEKDELISSTNTFTLSKMHN